MFDNTTSSLLYPIGEVHSTLDGHAIQTGKMSFRLERIRYYTLLFLGIYWSKGAIDQYYEGNTSFDISHEPVTPADLPVMTLCPKGTKHWEWLKKQKSFTFKYNDYMNRRADRGINNVTFSLKNSSGNNEALSWTLDDPDTLLNVRPICTQYARMCLQISFDNEKAIRQWGQNFTRKVADFWLYFNMDFSKAEYSKGEDEEIGNHTFWLYISSHSNSFGVNFQHLDEDLPYPRFFGGSVQKVEMKTGKQTQLAITSLKEFRHEYECSKKLTTKPWQNAF